ncbi:hypothetical protein ACJ41O_010832 [Fusarium nematophilum]
MASFKSILGGLAVMTASAYAAIDMGDKDEMGPAAFMWPADRVWSAAMDNTAPCGSVASPGNRSEFPLEKGAVALVGQDESFDIQLSISYSSDPKSNSDFETLIEADWFRSIDPGHTCVQVPDAPGDVSPGDNATLQIKYIATFDNPENETFYACADITYVTFDDFDQSIPCFNATRPGGDDGDDDDDDPHHFDDDDDEKDDDDDDDDDDNSSSSGSESGSSNKDKGSSGLSGGATAGIVIGSLAGVAFVALAAFLLYRRKSRKEGAIRQQQTARGVSWDDQPPKTSQSTGDVRMDNLEGRGH